MKVLFHSNLKLSLEPISVENLVLLKSDPELHRILKEASLYIIAQRPILLFSDLEREGDKIKFKIVQPLTKKEIYCQLPIYQQEVINDRKLEFTIQPLSDFNMYPEPRQALPQYIESIIFKNKNESPKVLKWFAPDAILELFWSKKIECQISGDIQEFATYKVKYVGEAVIQEIWERLSKHENLQKILSLETSSTPSVKLPKELMVLFFKITDTFDKRVLNEMSDKEISDYYKLKDAPKTENIFYDAEKALINVLNPEFNNRIYKAYPKSKNGLINEQYQNWSYSITDAVKLVYKDGEIDGNKDIILVTKENKPIIIKME